MVLLVLVPSWMATHTFVLRVLHYLYLSLLQLHFQSVLAAFIYTREKRWMEEVARARHLDGNSCIQKGVHYHTCLSVPCELFCAILSFNDVPATMTALDSIALAGNSLSGMTYKPRDILDVPSVRLSMMLNYHLDIIKLEDAALCDILAVTGITSKRMCANPAGNRVKPGAR